MKSDFNGDGKADVLWQNTSGSRVRRETQRAGRTRWSGDPGVSRQAALRRVRESFNFAERESGAESPRCDRNR